MEKFKNIGIALVVIIAVVGIVVYGVMQRGKQTSQTTGEILETAYEYDSKNRRTGISYRYRFTADGKEYTRSSSASLEERDYVRGARGTICYNPDDPSSSNFSLSEVNCGGK